LNDLYSWRDRWYNVYVGYQPDGVLRGFYCNVGLPPVITDHTLSFVDLDIDVRIWPDNRFELLDLDEFREHAATFGWPPEVQRAACDAMLDILFRWRQRKTPFDLIR
jgi:protein associated with RNAse G/E